MIEQDKFFDNLDKELSENESNGNVLVSAIIIFLSIILIFAFALSVKYLISYNKVPNMKAETKVNTSDNDIDIFEKIEVIIDDKVYDISECTSETVNAGICKCNLKYKTGEEVTKNGYISFNFEDNKEVVVKDDEFLRIILPKEGI